NDYVYNSDTIYVQNRGLSLSKAGRYSSHNFAEYQETVAFDTVRVPMLRNGTPVRDGKLKRRLNPCHT
ncbi:hypothetical protein JW960_24910, partial [candidate division KSB1 bacterium]|nr:hypothetical protein [candidate division KSB1 bacterium]